MANELDAVHCSFQMIDEILKCYCIDVQCPKSKVFDKLNVFDVISNPVNHPINKSSFLFLFYSYLVSHAHITIRWLHQIYQS